MTLPDWQWNEMQQVGTDYTELAEVEAHDRRMGSFRDVDAENASMLATLGLPRGVTVLEIGCGTGRFVRAAAAAGQFILRDVVFSLAEGEAPEACFARFADFFPDMRKEAARHAAREFSTYDWIMDGLLERAGFVIDEKQAVGESFLVYHAHKE